MNNRLWLALPGIGWYPDGLLGWDWFKPSLLEQHCSPFSVLFCVFCLCPGCGVSGSVSWFSILSFLSQLYLNFFPSTSLSFSLLGLCFLVCILGLCPFLFSAPSPSPLWTLPHPTSHSVFLPLYPIVPFSSLLYVFSPLPLWRLCSNFYRLFVFCNFKINFCLFCWSWC